MSFKRFAIGASGLGVALVGLHGHAQTTEEKKSVTGKFVVTVEVLKECKVLTTETSALKFEAVPAQKTSQAKTKSFELDVECSKGTSYQVGLSPASAASATSGAGSMAMGDTGEKIKYQLQTAENKDWGNAENNRVTGSGDGTIKKHLVNAVIEANAFNVKPGTYKDTINVSVTY